MTSSPLADAPRPAAAAADVNDAIRRLMEQPADTRRAEEYVRLLSLWADTTPAWTTAA
ncbi:hypothetical protein GCM10023347_51250 [Streptomyces chumphonensis]|uniref:Uncharacterized protein n=1 Tax=Streptomyces chumphonensis TaxID=1214925 RepID=A0A927F504_9ACTN|nr:hypothetical protein [Streptomyces chumphonensis]MBD3934477.1 hypothetical protein [Streptomyces chumphonensis]